MTTLSWGIAILSAVASANCALATSNGDPVRRAGVGADGGLTCTQCHNQFAPPVNQGPGRVVVNSNAYVPGSKQNLTIQITDNAALRWGFQVTARIAADETRQAGSFTANESIRVLCDTGGEAPCGGSLEFATHRAASTGGGAGGQRTYVLEWTAPGRDVGQVVFYAAGLAANNDGSESGDRTYTGSLRIGTTGCGFTNKPVINVNGIVNGASFQPGISPSSLITILGSGFANLGSRFAATKSDLVAGRLPVEMACVAVEIGGARAPLFYTQNDQINAQAPALLGVGPTQGYVILNPGAANELRSDPFFLQVQLLSPGLFTYDGVTSVKGRNASDGNRILADPAIVPGGVFGRPGDIVTLYGTGFGPTNPFYQSGEFSTAPARLVQQPTVTIGGITLAEEDVLYAGLSPDLPGLYQFNLRVPQVSSDGNLVVAVRIGGAQTQAGATIPVKR